MRRHPMREPTAATPVPVGLLRDLAARGGLADAMADATSSAELRVAAYDVVWPLVWARHTRRLESAKGHARCASSFGRLESACLDGFHDDVEAVVDYLTRHARKPIHCVEGWITSRIPAAVVDGHRRRRGWLGALQRVRVPKWLVARLDDDPWLVELAARVIEWVGVTHTAGLETWPIDAWVELRARVTGDRSGSLPGRVAGELAQVLTTMREARPDWYAAYVERPLGGKQLPLACSPDDGQREEGPDAARLRAESEDARLAALAAAAVDAIEDGLAAGRAPDELVPTVVTALFLEHPATSATDRERWLDSVLADERGVADVVRRVLAVVRHVGCAGGQARQ